MTIRFVIDDSARRAEHGCGQGDLPACVVREGKRGEGRHAEGRAGGQLGLGAEESLDAPAGQAGHEHGDEHRQQQPRFGDVGGEAVPRAGGCLNELRQEGEQRELPGAEQQRDKVRRPDHR
jgi:hypothetical protein